MLTILSRYQKWIGLFGLVLYVSLNILTPELAAAVVNGVNGPRPMSFKFRSFGYERLVFHHHDLTDIHTLEEDLAFHAANPDVEPDYSVRLPQKQKSRAQNPVKSPFELLSQAVGQVIIVPFWELIRLHLEGDFTIAQYPNPPPILPRQSLDARQTIVLTI